MDKKIFWVILFVFIDILGFSLILPLLPYYGEQFKAGPFLIGSLMTANAVAQMLAGPIIGRLSDIYGRKPLLILSICGTIVSFTWLGRAQHLWELFGSRILDGLLGGNISLAQAYVSDVTTESERAKGIGMVMASFGVGFIIGPAIGGFLVTYGYQVPAYAAAVISVINLMGVIAQLPESLPPEKREKAHGALNFFPTELILRAFSMKILGPLLLLRFFYLFTFTLFESTLPYFNAAQLKLDAQNSSWTLAFIGFWYAGVQGSGAKLFKKYGEGKVIFFSFFIFAISMMVWGTSTTLRTSLMYLVPVSLSSGLLNTLINSEITRQVQQSELGSTLGISSSVGSLARILAPISAGFIIENYESAASAYVGAILMFFCGVYAYSRGIHNLSTTHLPNLDKAENPKDVSTD